MSNFWAVVTISIIAPLVGGIIGGIIAFRVNRKNDRNRESRERQAKLEAFWKEEQLRLNPRAVLADELPPVKKYEWGEWDACEQHLAQAERRLIEYCRIE